MTDDKEGNMRTAQQREFSFIDYRIDAVYVVPVKSEVWTI